MTQPRADPMEKDTAEIRPATRADFPGIVALLAAADELFWICPRCRQPFTPAQMERIATEREALTVVELDGQVVGFANLYQRQAGESAFIGNVVVGVLWRGRGLGRRLIETMQAIAVQHYGLREIRISVFNDNTAALLLYSELGFVPYAGEARETPAGERAVLLHLRRDLIET